MTPSDSEASQPSHGPVVDDAKTLFEATFGGGRADSSGDVIICKAPGRVNLIGEHTDYSGGFVLPMALEKECVVYGRGKLTPNPAKPGILSALWGGAKKDEGEEQQPPVCKIVSDAAGLGEAEVVEFVASEDLKPGSPKWGNYVKGVVFQYLQDIPANHTLSFEVAIASSVPLGGGLSSSAALEVAIATFLDEVLQVSTPGEAKALRCQQAEHTFAGNPCGIMDQFISVMGETGTALLVDCRSYETKHVKLDDPGLAIVVCNSNVHHSLADSAYGQRVKECAAAVDMIAKEHPEVQQLRDATADWVEAILAPPAAGAVGDTDEAAVAAAAESDRVYRRARHVVTENERAVQAGDAFSAADYHLVGRLMAESHNSLRDDFEVSCKELDLLVDIAMGVPGVYGSRMTGGGFGGCTVSLVKASAADELMETFQRDYPTISGLECSCFVSTASAGATVLQSARSTGVTESHADQADQAEGGVASNGQESVSSSSGSSSKGTTALWSAVAVAAAGVAVVLLTAVTRSKSR